MSFHVTFCLNEYLLREIGGLTDVEMTMYKQANIDSLDKSADISRNGFQIGEPPARKRRKSSYTGDENNNNSNFDEAVQSNALDLTLQMSRSYSPAVSRYDPPSTKAPKIENLTFDHALDKLNKGLTEYEEEQIQKKKQLAVLLTNEKTKAYMEMYKLKLGSHPELLGLLPSSSLEDQLTAGFDLWLFEYKQSICAKVDDIHKFINQVTLLRSDYQDWNEFLHKWKLHRIFHRDAFLEVWSFVVQELNISLVTEKIDEEKEEHFDLNASVVA